MSALPAPAEVRADVVLALALANHGRAGGELVDMLRRRLCGYIRTLAEPARQWAQAQTSGASRTGHLATVRQAVEIADSGGRSDSDPAQSLRVLAKAVDILARMAGATGDPRRDREPR